VTSLIDRIKRSVSSAASSLTRQEEQEAVSTLTPSSTEAVALTPPLSAGDELEVEWPLAGGGRGLFSARVERVRLRDRKRRGSWFKYDLLFEDGDRLSSRLGRNRRWSRKTNAE